jgi:hypothetical protein
MPWTAGFNLENHRDPLAKGTGDLQMLTVQLDLNGPDATMKMTTRFLCRRQAVRWRHGRKTRELDSEHHSTNGKYREGVKDMASSPRAKSEARVVPMRRAARDGRRLGFTLAVAVLTSITAASRGRDGGNWERHPTYIALEWFQVRKEEIGSRI